MLIQKQLTIQTQGRGFYPLDELVNELVEKSQVSQGICQIFIQHTSASLLITENADPTVLQDLTTFFSHLAPDSDANYRHNTEGIDDMSAHIRTMLGKTDLLIPIMNKHLCLGTWQGIFLWEHRLKPHSRQLIISIWNG